MAAVDDDSPGVDDDDDSSVSRPVALNIRLRREFIVCYYVEQRSSWLSSIPTSLRRPRYMTYMYYVVGTYMYY